MFIATLWKNSQLNEAGLTGLIVTVLMVLTYPAMAVPAMLPSVGGFAVALAASYIADWVLHARHPEYVGWLRQVRFGLSNRFLVREMLLILLLARLPGAHGFDDRMVVLATLAFTVLVAVQLLHGVVVTMLRKARALPYITRNIELTGLHVPDAPPRWLENRAGEKILHTDIPIVAGLLVTAVTDDLTPAYWGTAATFALALGYLALLALRLRPSQRVAHNGAALKWLDGWMRDYAPTVALHFSGTKESTYQVDMWLRTLEKLEGERPLIILREPHTVPTLARTSVPVLCLPSAVHLMNLDVSSIRVGLYPAHVGKNLHLLRVPTMKHAFIGHGDSDKVASINPFGKAYEELWTAGKAGRDRWALADVGVRDEDVVEVGRPQLDVIETDRTASEIPTVLYAPTWEGWTDTADNTSLVRAGEHIVRRLLEAEPPVRVIYKPHPFTGNRDPKAKRADARITELIEAANQGRPGETERPAQATPPGRDLSTLNWRDAAVSRDAIDSPADVAADREAAADADAAYWAAQPADRHLVVKDAGPTIYSCFNRSDALVSDISSVVSDFIASGKPLAVADTAGVGETAFKQANTAARAAFILDRHGHGLDALLEAVREPEADPLAEARDDLRGYLLGPDEPSAQERFGQAVKRLGDRAEERRRKQQRAEQMAETPPAT